VFCELNRCRKITVIKISVKRCLKIILRCLRIGPLMMAMWPTVAPPRSQRAKSPGTRTVSTDDTVSRCLVDASRPSCSPPIADTDRSPPAKGKGKKYGFGTCYSTSYTGCNQKCFAISEVAADRSKLMTPQRTMRPSIARTIRPAVCSYSKRFQRTVEY